jgi:hypothetical protein
MPEPQDYRAWFTNYPSTHGRAGETVEVVPRAWAEAEVARLREENVRYDSSIQPSPMSDRYWLDVQDKRVAEL